MKMLYYQYKSSFLQKIRSFFSRLIHPGYSWCYRCKMSWASVERHCTNYTETRGCFPLCEKCWKSLTIEERFPYYRLLWASWSQENRPAWELIEKAVGEGN